ncbi:MAG: type II toxin-antitoxin system prevent-host-death family antitoxin [Candidatus Aminicenantes bacterium]|nr:type II toxin-antitoxin system prevent-host-death family antitoxin [Candidatus Aminicenantes bacterium]NIM77941.1 type II toxin-antitoxin system prevent-host-death family antitoxin [Candidatus Aminicenantes bacterium]NIN22758.1 type II toxin-antitoxin system prevent-host-death family antitoxin [Candidatus Aminicenantes bacterium]NIN45924.1 type II toxin-antitoxin system prevent-host-death family antitoxin [Candidatus Aminicenantes bacterium]NIN89400.1 type II toxin-antitoxin system prevent-h
MKLSEDIKPITYVKTHSSDLIREVNTNKRPIVITQNGTARAVLLDIDSYEKQKNTLLMLKLVAQGESDIKKGNLVEQEEFFKKMDEHLDV